MRGHGDFEVIGETLDDAAGEAFDKVSRMLGLGYPGGPAISRAAENGNPSRYDLPRAWLKKGSFDFSFSGLKSAVLRIVQAEMELFPLAGINEQVSFFGSASLCHDVNKNDMAASFQEAATDVLSKKLAMAAEKFDAKEVHLAGGVSANGRLRELVQERVQGRTLRFPKKIEYCTDNAAMIAAAGYFLQEKNAGRKNVSAKASF